MTNDAMSLAGSAPNARPSAVGTMKAICGWALGIACFLWAGLAIPAEPDTNLVVLRIMETNAVAPSSGETNPPVLSVTETNAPPLSTEDTNSAILGNLEDHPVLLQAGRSPLRLDLQSFRIIWERNIFNPNRSPRYTRSAPTQRREPERRRRITESFALIGTMSYEKGRFAFFEGSSSQYQKALETSDTIGGYKIAAITTTMVRLETTNGQAIELPVGMQLKKEDEGDWILSERAESSSSDSYRRSSVSSAGSSGGSSEALKRLMERREQEGNSEATNTTEAPMPVEEEKPDTAEKGEKPSAGPPGGADEVLRRLLQKREQEVNK